MVMKPLATTAFSILPLAIAEMSAPVAAVDPAATTQVSHAFAQAAKGSAAAALDAVNTIITTPAVSAPGALINLFHVNAIATFRDAMGAFIDESAARAAGRSPLSHSRAWKITAGAVAADLLLLGYWLATCRREEPGDAIPVSAVCEGSR